MSYTSYSDDENPDAKHVHTDNSDAEGTSDDESVSGGSILDSLKAGTLAQADMQPVQFAVFEDFVRAGIDYGDHVYHMRTYPNCFVGREFVALLREELDFTDEAAVALGQRMLDLRLIEHVVNKQPFRDGYFFYRFRRDIPTKLLNMRTVWLRDVREAPEVTATLRRHLDRLVGAFLADDLRTIDVEAMRASREFEEFQLATAELQRVDLSVLSETQRLCMFVNLYNMCMIHGKVVFGMPQTTRQRSTFFGSVGYSIGGLDFTLDDMEHGILRANALPVGCWVSPRFSADDPRAAFALTDPNPLIHFALNCGGESCPAIRVYTPDNIHDGLEWAARGFLEDELIVDAESGNVTMSMIFKWYGGDFGPDTDSILRCCLPYLDVSAAAAVNAVLEREGGYTVTYAPWNWGV